MLEPEILAECTCPMSTDEVILRFSRHCPIADHAKHAPPAETLTRRWCSGSSESVTVTSKRTGQCRGCLQIVPQKYGIAGVHYPDGSTPRE